MLSSILVESCATLSYLPGFQDFVFLLSSPTTGVRSLPPLSGPESALLLGSLHLTRLRSILRAIESALQSRLAGSDWFHHLPLVLLGLPTVPKDATGLSVSKLVYGSSLTLPGEFLGSPELPPASFLRKIEDAIGGFGIPPPHHVRSSPPQQLPPALLAAEFVFV